MTQHLVSLSADHILAQHSHVMCLHDTSHVLRVLVYSHSGFAHLAQAWTRGAHWRRALLWCGRWAMP